MSTLELASLLRSEHIIPQILPEEMLSTIKGPLTVRYPSGLEISIGDEASAKEVQETPEVEFPLSDPSASYTLIMIDPDLLRENDKVSGQVRHFLQAGILFNSAHKAAAQFQNVVTTNYIPPSPALLTGKHRYIFILAREPPTYMGTTSYTYAELPQGDVDLIGRMGFDVVEYLRHEKLEVEAVAWMKVEADWETTKRSAGLVLESVEHKLVGK